MGGGRETKKRRAQRDGATRELRPGDRQQRSTGSHLKTSERASECISVSVNECVGERERYAGKMVNVYVCASCNSDDDRSEVDGKMEQDNSR